MRHVQSALFWVFPAIEVCAIERILSRRQAEEADQGAWDKEVKRWEWRFDRQVEGVEVARALYRADVERLRRLEDKLRAGLSFITPLVPLSTALAGLALKTSCWVAWIAFGLATAALIQLVCAYLLIQRGVTAFPLALSGPATLADALDSHTNVMAQIAAVEMASLHHNQARGFQLNNAIVGVEGSLLRSVICLGAGTVILVYLRY